MMFDLHEATPTHLTEQTAAALAPMSSEAPVFVDVTPGPNATPDNCYSNVQEAVRQRGGSAVYGWIVWISGRGHYLKIVHHAVWRSPEGLLLDVTPSDDRRNLFLPDPQQPYRGRWVRPHYFPLKPGSATSGPHRNWQGHRCIRAESPLRRVRGGDQGSSSSPPRVPVSHGEGQPERQVPL